VVSHKVGERAKLTRISASHFGGLGAKAQTGYLAVANHIQIGELAFQDCIVFVSDKNSVGNEDGLIGADVSPAISSTSTCPECAWCSPAPDSP